MDINKQNINNQLGALGSRFNHLIDYLSGIRKISVLGKENESKDTLINNMVRIVFEYLDAEDVSLYLKKDVYLQRAAHLNWEKFIANEDAIINEDKNFSLDENLAGKSARTRTTQHVNDCALNGQAQQSEIPYNTGSVIYAPVVSGEKLQGVVELYHPERNHFDHWQEYAVTIYADLIGLLLNHHQLMHCMQLEIDERTVDLKEALKESNRLRKRYEEMSIIDHLTRLYNRRFFFNEVASGLSRAVRYNQPFSMLLMDLDHFKVVNDSHGHDCGDAMLKNIATTLSRFTREGDTLARYGGEEFILALPNTDIDGACKLAERIRKTVETSELEWNNENISITISIGVTSMCHFSEGDEEIVNYNPQVADLIREADRALYYVKQNGRNAVKNFFDMNET